MSPFSVHHRARSTRVKELKEVPVGKQQAYTPLAERTLSTNDRRGKPLSIRSIGAWRIHSTVSRFWVWASRDVRSMQKP